MSGISIEQTMSETERKAFNLAAEKYFESVRNSSVPVAQSLDGTDPYKLDDDDDDNESPLI